MSDLHLTGRVGRGFEWDGWMQQVQELTDRNAELLTALDSKDQEIAALEERLIAAEPAGGGSFAAGGGDPRDAKIIELSRRNRALNLGLQKKKQKYADSDRFVVCSKTRTSCFPLIHASAMFHYRNSYVCLQS